MPKIVYKGYKDAYPRKRKEVENALSESNLERFLGDSLEKVSKIVVTFTGPTEKEEAQEFFNNGFSNLYCKETETVNLVIDKYFWFSPSIWIWHELMHVNQIIERRFFYKDVGLGNKALYGKTKYSLKWYEDKGPESVWELDAWENLERLLGKSISPVIKGV